jgi:hypothetical protein
MRPSRLEALRKENPYTPLELTVAVEFYKLKMDVAILSVMLVLIYQDTTAQTTDVSSQTSPRHTKFSFRESLILRLQCGYIVTNFLNQPTAFCTFVIYYI